MNYKPEDFPDGYINESKREIRTFDEYFEELRKQQNGQVKEYEVLGFYNFHKKQNNFTGLFGIDSHGKIVGQITDSNSICPKHLVDGNIYLEKNPQTIEFIKIPTTLLARIHYSLTRADGSREIDGEYRGNWQLREKALNLKTKLSEKEKENQAQLILSKSK